MLTRCIAFHHESIENHGSQTDYMTIFVVFAFGYFNYSQGNGSTGQVDWLEAKTEEGMNDRVRRKERQINRMYRKTATAGEKTGNNQSKPN